MSAKTNSDTAENTGMTDITLTPQQKKAWEDVMSMMVWTAPGFQHIFYKLLNGQNSGREHVAIMSRDVPVAATDGRNVIINPDTFFGEFNLREQVFVTAHEIIHNVYGDVELLHRCRTSSRVPLHDGTHRPFDNDCMQKAMDARINALLIESRIGKAPKKGHFDDQVAGADSVLDIYQRYYDKKYPDGDGGDQPGPGDQQGNQNPGGFDQLMPPGAATGQNPQQAAGQRNQQQWAVEIASAQTIEQQRSQGKMAAALKRMFKELLEPEVPWVDHIETLINRATGGGGYDWTQPNPWLGGTDTGDQYFAPADTGHGAGWIVIWGDTSGSRSDQELASNIAELRGIMEDVNPARLTLIWCDAEIEDGSVVEITDPAELNNLQPVGGGGTNYQPVLDWIAAQGDTPELFIGFTDGEVNHPHRELPYPTIWASSTDVPYPFGQVVRVNKRART